MRTPWTWVWVDSVYNKTLQQQKFPLLRVPDLDADARGDRTQPVCGDPAVRPEGLFLHLHAVRQLSLHHRCGGVPFHHPDARGHLLLPEDLGPGSSGQMEGETWQQTKAEAPGLQEFCHHVCGFCPLRHLLGSSEFHWSRSGLRPRQHGTQDPRVAVCGQLLYGVFQQLPQCDHIWTTEPKFQAGIPKNYSLIVYHPRCSFADSSNHVANRIKRKPSPLIANHNLIKVARL
uniref:Melatonin receptor 1a n=1 Tax=Axis axis TaxID=30531 RepID=A0A5P9VLZ7_AXIAX|nr:melatonin receptor 1a [Axis axis]